MKRSVLIGLMFVCLLAGPLHAEEWYTVDYLCADWGPAMKLPATAGEKPQFNDNYEEVYFIKQLGSFTRKQRLLPDWLGDNSAATAGHGVSIYLCKMKPDGSDKTEIKELWHNVTYPIDTQAQSSWMDINRKTRKIALAVAYAGSDITALWTMNLDGSDFKKIITPEQTHQYLQSFNHPSWTPDGQSIVLEEDLRGMNPDRFNIARCDANGGNFKRIFESTEKIEYMQPSVSPDGILIAFLRFPNGYPGPQRLWLASLDGSDAHQVVNKRGEAIGGDCPAWSPDGKKLLIVNQIIDPTTGLKLLERDPVCLGKRYTCGWPQWGKPGFIGFTVSGILFTDDQLKEAKVLGLSQTAECRQPNPQNCRW